MLAKILRSEKLGWQDVRLEFLYYYDARATDTKTLNKATVKSFHTSVNQEHGYDPSKIYLFLKTISFTLKVMESEFGTYV